MRRTLATAAGLTAATTLVLVALALPGPGARASVDRPGVFVLGVDGMDPQILRSLIDAGAMPHFAALAAGGTFQELGTSNPPQSPVAWSNFVTGRNPGGHGIYDFIHRDPATYGAVSSATTVVPPAETWDLFGLRIPSPFAEQPENNRTGTPFWDVLHDAGVDVEVYRMPGNFPPTPSEAKTLSGMGTVDLTGGFGKYSWYSSDVQFRKSDAKRWFVEKAFEDDDLDQVPDVIRTRLHGPPDLLRPPPPGRAEPDPLTVPLTIHRDPEADAVWLRLPDADAILVEGEWSPWLPVSFDALPWGLLPVQGVVRFYLKQARPELELYASPVNIAPEAAIQPITTPSDWAPELAEAIGSAYYTQGMPEEVNALKEGLFDDDDYVSQVEVVHDEEERLLAIALERFEAGDATFFYLSDIDLQSHMLWRHRDPKHPDAPPHPAFEEEPAKRHADAIEGYYRHVDATLGRVRARLPEGTLLVVMSDHGFQPFTRAFHLNAWLREEGFLVLKDDARTGSVLTPPSADGHTPDWEKTSIDWSRTKAYGIGFNALYLNLAGREHHGIVTAARRDEVLDAISERLRAYRDPEGGRPVVRRVDRGTEVYTGERLGDAPDLVLGYDAGYGCSEESTLGTVTEEVIEDNTGRWSGNHLMAPEVVPGVLLVNRPLARSGHDLTDLTATLLDHYGLEPVDGMVGTSILR